jgi:outer membrane protein assembly factor BamB
MTGPDRHDVVAITASVALLWAVGVRAQATQAPSTLLPMEPLWTTVLSAAPAAAPVHDAGYIFVALRDGHVTAVNVADGEVAWEVELPVVGELATGGALLYVGSRNALQGIEAASGRVRWSIPLEAPLSAPLVWNNSWLIAALDTQILLAIRAETGETLWRQNLGGGIHVAPSLAGDRMYVSLDSGGVAALSLMTGAVLWEQRLGGTPSRILPLDDLFVGATDNHFYRLSRTDGAIQWNWRTGGDIVGLPAVDEKRVYFSSLDNMLWALNRTSGVQQWREPLSARPTAGPSHTGDLLVLGGMSQNLRFFDPATGASYGRITAPSELAFPPLILSTAPEGPLLVTVTGEGQLRALRRALGPELLDLSVTAILGEDAVYLPKVLLRGILVKVGLFDVELPRGRNLARPHGFILRVNDEVRAATGPLDAADVEAGALPVIRPSGASEYAIQVAAFSNDASATALVDRLIELGYPAYVITPRQDEEFMTYRVRVGDYPDRPAAEAIGRQVEAEQVLDWYVVALP